MNRGELRRREWELAQEGKLGGQIVERWPIDDHAARPGPMYWDWKCLTCDELVRLHAPFIVRWWRRWRRR